MFLTIFCREITVKNGTIRLLQLPLQRSKLQSRNYRHAVQSDEFLSSKYESEGELNRISDLEGRTYGIYDHYRLGLFCLGLFWGCN